MATQGNDIAALIGQASAHQKWPLARLISLVERNLPDAREQRDQIMQVLSAREPLDDCNGLVVGVTGTPGAGKSSLISEVCQVLLGRDSSCTIAVLAIDPSSEDSGGALLGDRTRMQLPVNEPRIFFRSQASARDLGGVGPQTFQVVRLLRQLFDYVIIETVGIGQSEVEVRQLSDHTLLVMQPLAGDQVQFLKAGIMEIPDAFVVNKCDEEALAQKSLHMLQSSLKLTHLALDQRKPARRLVFMTSAMRKRGIDELAAHLVGLHNDTGSRRDRKAQEDYHLRKWIRQEYGRYGIRVYEQRVLPLRQSDNAGIASSYEAREAQFIQAMEALISRL
ncbi:MAG: protein kinase [Hahellaceae bacterium]|nr:protein kinase [Hahellaceae bacterium]